MKLQIQEIGAKEFSSRQQSRFSLKDSYQNVDSSTLFYRVREPDGGELFLSSRGEAFPADWVREISLFSTSPLRHPRLFFRALASYFFEEGVVSLRWTQDIDEALKYERFREDAGVTIRAIELDPETAKITHLSFQLKPENPHYSFKGPRGLSIGPIRLADTPLLEKWIQDPKVFRPLGHSRAPTAEALKQLVFARMPDDSLSALTVFAFRYRGQFVGFSVEYDWTYLDDSIREVDFALPALEKSSSALTLEAMMLVQHGCYQRGASRVLTNSRQSASGRGLDKVFSLIGASDVSEWVNAFGLAEEGRRYFSSSAEEFYESRLGLRIQSHIQ